MDSPLIIVADVRSEPENADELGRILTRFADECLAEPGCMSFDVLRSVRRPERYVTIEKYADVEALITHPSLDRVRSIARGELVPLVTAADVRRYTSMDR